MKIKTGGREYSCLDYQPGGHSVRYLLGGDVPAELGEDVVLLDNTDGILAVQSVSAWLRWEIRGRTLVLTNRPETPGEPAQKIPSQSEINAQAIAELSMAQAQQAQAIAELSMLTTGGGTDAV